MFYIQVYGSDLFLKDFTLSKIIFCTDIKNAFSFYDEESAVKVIRDISFLPNFNLKLLAISEDRKND